jgi:hypothetical protein
MRKYIVSITLILVIHQLNFAQSIYSTKGWTEVRVDTGYVPDAELVESMNPRKSLLVPMAEAIGLNLALGAFNAYVMDSEFAKISFKTIKHNHEIGFTTDADGFITNMFAHPFHGSIYYNAARSTGHNYWASLGVAAFGSWQWEFFMENEPPALNDWIMTSVGGSMIGEMFYRFSNLILDESKSGSARFWNELAAGIFNPGRLFNRLIYGRTRRVTTKKLYETMPSTGELAIGGNNVAEGTNFENGSKNVMLTTDYSYGIFFRKRHLKPFDFFRFYGAFNFGGTQPLIGQFRIYSNLHTKVNESKNFLWGVFQHYDYLQNNVYQVGGTSIGLGIAGRTSQAKSTQFIGTLHLAGLLMGGANSDYSQDYKVSFLDSARSYNMGPGAHAKMELLLRFSFGSLYLGYSFWWIHTWDGAPGDEYIGMWTPRVRVRLTDRWYLGLEYLLYHRRGVYDDYDDRSLQNNEQRLFVAYVF